MTLNSDERFVLVVFGHRTLEADREMIRMLSSSPSAELFCVASEYCGIHADMDLSYSVLFSYRQIRHKVAISLLHHLFRRYKFWYRLKNKSLIFYMVVIYVFTSHADILNSVTEYFKYT
jgi:hypothetical protein